MKKTYLYDDIIVKSASSYICHEVHDSHRFLPALGARRQAAAVHQAYARVHHQPNTDSKLLPNYDFTVHWIK